MALRKMTPGGYEYLTGNVACADHDTIPGESMADYYLAHGYPPGEWIGTGAETLGIAGEATEAHMLALFGEGRHPRADELTAQGIAEGHSVEHALGSTKLGRRFPQYGGHDELRQRVAEAYKQHTEHDRHTPLDAATRQRLRDRVHREAFAEAHDGRKPRNRAELHGWVGDQKRALRAATAGYELVFAPDKATSVAWAIADPVTSELIANAHRQAVRDAVALFESEVAHTRAGNYGQAQMDVRGVTAAVFEHWDSRTGDPHLHSHVPISAKVQRSDGQWTSLDGRTVHAAAVTVSEFYNNRVRDLLGEQGAAFVQRPADGLDLKRPVWELDGVPTDLVRAWSQRSQHIEQERARRIVAFRRDHDREPTPKELLELTRRAQYGTRPAKAPPKTLQEHRNRWATFADSVIGAEHRDTLGRRLFTRTTTQGETYDLATLAQQTRQAVSEHKATFNRWNLTAEAHRQTAGLRLAPDQRDRLIDDVVTTVLTAPDTVALQAPSVVDEPQSLRRTNGESVFIEHNAAKYTTEDTLAKEHDLVRFAQRQDGQRLTPDTIAAAVRDHADSGTTLNTAQTQMVTEFARSGSRVQLALAPAGTGKTTAMRVFAAAWRSAGGRVYAFGPSARAAHELGDAIGATPHTLHQVPEALKHGVAERVFPFARGDVLIVDEAAMSGTHTLHTVVDYAVRRGADVRLVGDDRQLTAIEAGGVVRLLAHDVGAVRLGEVLRFRDPAQADASLLMRRGDPTGIGYYREQGWIQDGSIETMRDAAQRNWHADLAAGRETLLIVGRNDDVVALNRAAHEHRVTRGDVTTDATAQLHDGTTAGGGDWVVTRDNARSLTVFAGKDFVKNGDTWTVRHVHPDGSLWVQHREHTGAAILPSDYVARHVELAYATTINRTQGMTVADAAHTVVTPETTREQLYPGITRSAGANRMYVVTSQHVADAHQETPSERSTEHVLTSVLRHSGIELSATEVLRNNLGSEESLATLVARHDYATQQLSDARYRDLVGRVSPEAGEADASPALWQTLRNAENTGWQAERLLPKVIAQGNLADADDVAAVLVYRIERYTADHQPPARIAEPTPAELQRWRSAVHNALPDANVDNDSWHVVWRHAAGGARQGLDADAAITASTMELDSHRDESQAAEPRLARGVVSHLAEQGRCGHGDQPAVPWLARHHRAGIAPSRDTELDNYLTAMDSAIAQRADELREQLARERPEWARHLGARPGEGPEDVAAWDHAATLAAAYRETFGISNTSPGNPLGSRPDGNAPQARAWDTVAELWNRAVTSTTRDPSETQHDLDVLRDELSATAHEHAGYSTRLPGYEATDDDSLNENVNRSSGIGHGL